MDKKIARNPTGKGGFGDHPENINRDGAPTRGNSWGERIKDITNMTRNEAIAFVGARTRIGRLLKELPPNIPIKDALIFSSIIAYGREPNARMLNALMDREDGKPNQHVDLTSGNDKITEIGVKLIDYRTGITATEERPESNSETSSQDEDTGNGSQVG